MAWALEPRSSHRRPLKVAASTWRLRRRWEGAAPTFPESTSQRLVPSRVVTSTCSCVHAVRTCVGSTDPAGVRGGRGERGLPSTPRIAVVGHSTPTPAIYEFARLDVGRLWPEGSRERANSRGHRRGGALRARFQSASVSILLQPLGPFPSHKVFLLADPEVAGPKLCARSS